MVPARDPVFFPEQCIYEMKRSVEVGGHHPIKIGRSLEIKRAGESKVVAGAG